MHESEDRPPEGFEIQFPDEPFEMYVGPHYFSHQNGELVAGFRAKSQHGNSAGNVHGGSLSAFADSALTGFALDLVDQTHYAVATISLNCDFTAPVRVGDWVECRGSISHQTRSLVFIQGRMTVDDRLVMSSSAVLRLIQLRRD